MARQTHPRHLDGIVFRERAVRGRGRAGPRGTGPGWLDDNVHVVARRQETRSLPRLRAGQASRAGPTRRKVAGAGVDIGLTNGPRWR